VQRDRGHGALVGFLIYWIARYAKIHVVSLILEGSKHEKEFRYFLSLTWQAVQERDRKHYDLVRAYNRAQCAMSLNPGYRIPLVSVDLWRLYK
jgi:hypothetical protein